VVHLVIIGLNVEPELWMTSVSLSNPDDLTWQLSESDPPPFQARSMNLKTTFFPFKILRSYHPDPILSALAVLDS